MKSLAPILIQVYTRKQHFINCVESLARCRLADQSHLIIASDAGKTEDDQLIVQEIREYCSSLTGFETVDVLAFDKNLGALEAGTQAVDCIFSKYDRFIYTEDDNMFSPNFLEYINTGLEFYENDPNIFAICGYCPPIKIKKDYLLDIVSHTTCCAWGTGYWKEKYAKVDFYLNNYKHQIYTNKQKEDMIKAVSFPVFYQIERIAGGQAILGDIAISYHCYVNNMRNIYPKISLVRNMGCDGSGLNMKQSTGYSAQQIQKGDHQIQFVKDIKNNKYINSQFNRFQTAPHQSVFKTGVLIFRSWIRKIVLLRSINKSIK
jgi:hypothetical protein